MFDVFKYYVGIIVFVLSILASIIISSVLIISGIDYLIGKTTPTVNQLNDLILYGSIQLGLIGMIISIYFLMIKIPEMGDEADRIVREAKKKYPTSD